MPPSTVDAIVLLGWMERDEAVGFLRDQCYFESALDNQQAEALWNQYHARVEALPVRNIPPTQRYPIPPGEQSLVREFLRRFRGNNSDVTDVLRVDPMELVAFQTVVVSDRADHHHRQGGGWSRKTLVIDRPTANLPMRIEGDTIKLILPHAEHMIGQQPDGAFRIVQFAGFVSVVDLGAGRLLLKAGYHRSFAFARAVMNEPDAKDKLELVALTTNLPPQLSPAFPQPGLRTMVFGSRPPLFSDFFVPDLAMAVKLRKKRWETHIRITAVDDP